MERLRLLPAATHRALAIPGVVVCGVLLLSLSLIPAVRQFLTAILFGWAIYPWQTLPRITFNREIALDAVIMLSLAVAALHGVLRWWSGHAGGATPRWPFRATAKIAAMILLLFATSIAATGIIRQTDWLLSLQHPVGYTGKEESIIFGVYYALRMFAADHSGNLPETLDEVYPEYLQDKPPLCGDIGNGGPPERFRYFSGWRPATDPPDRILLASPSPRGDRRVILRLDGTVSTVFEDQYQDLLKEQGRSEAEE